MNNSANGRQAIALWS